MYKAFRYIGFAEGSSFLVLLFIAMPLKYLWEHSEAVRVVGTLHGVLFIFYVLIATFLAIKLKWSKKTLIWAYIASTIPFGPFIFDRTISARGGI